MGYYVNVEAGVKIFIEDVNPEGNKIILFIHGWPLSHKQFEYQFNVLPAMGYRCIGIDWRGFGNSDKPFSGYHYDRLTDDIRAVVGALRLDPIGFGEVLQSKVRHVNLTDEKWREMYPKAKVQVDIKAIMVRSGVIE